MGIITRLLLLLYVLAVMSALVVSAGVCLHFIPTQVWQNELQHLISRRETLAVIAVMFLASLCLFIAVFSTDKKNSGSKKDVELQKGSSSEIKITLQAISEVVERTALTVPGVREVTPKVIRTDGEIPVKIFLDITLGQGYSAPETSEKINRAVNDALMTATEMSGIPIEVKVTEVTHAVAVRERRVV